MSSADKPWHVLRRSRVHGTGVYAARKIPAGTRVFEYEGEIISPDEADNRHPVNPDDPFHTFFFALSNDTVIDGNVNGNDARWVNHSCEPNCETEETDDHRVYIVALEDIARGDELFFDYGLVLDERITKTVREQYLCLCGSPSCRGTMLALKRKPASKKVKAEVAEKPVKARKADAKKADAATAPAKNLKVAGKVKGKKAVADKKAVPAKKAAAAQKKVAAKKVTSKKTVASKKVTSKKAASKKAVATKQATGKKSVRKAA